MKITDQDVLYVAALANLQLREDERKRMVRDLNSILDYVVRLNQLDTSGVSPMAQVAATPEAVEHRQSSKILREDALHGLRPSLAHNTALVNAPESDGTFFLVPKVIER